MEIKKSTRKKDECRYDYFDKIRKSDYKKDWIYSFVLKTNDGTFFSADNCYLEEDDEYIFIFNTVMSGITTKRNVVRFETWGTKKEL